MPDDAQRDTRHQLFPMFLTKKGRARAGGMQQLDFDSLVYLKLLGVVISQDSYEAISMGIGFGMGGVPFCSTRLPLPSQPCRSVRHPGLR